MTTSGDTQALPRIPVPGTGAGSAHHPTVALTLAAAPEPQPSRAEVPAESADAATTEPAAEAPAESHERIYEEAMATIAALASGWSTSVQRTGRHRAAA
ncbi:hypothetical protein [Geodermatophilus sp. URMC 64]